MALYYTINFRGTVLDANFAIPYHVRIVSGFAGGTEAEICMSLAQGAASKWETLFKTWVSNRVNLVKVVVQAYQSETGFAEYAAGLIGDAPGDDLPSFIAAGFRQFRTNVLFRASKHAVPGVLEVNNADGQWVEGGGIVIAQMNAVAAFFGLPSTYTDLESVTGVVQPVLIRTQNTVKDPITGTKTTTFFDPHQICDVGGGQFYGLTSQVSRKRILKSS